MRTLLARPRLRCQKRRRRNLRRHPRRHPRLHPDTRMIWDNRFSSRARRAQTVFSFDSLAAQRLRPHESRSSRHSSHHPLSGSVCGESRRLFGMKCEWQWACACVGFRCREAVSRAARRFLVPRTGFPYGEPRRPIQMGARSPQKMCSSFFL